ncbi:hypothetical protein [Hydrogenophaga defluvii]|uniref:Uncharacterized protein n=1 Tax=Hydrogenophaga defluvii TaxID=249410 RepID=A0ABW2SDY9_9BURK
MTTTPQAPAKKAATPTAAKKVATPPAARKALAKAVPAPKPVVKAAQVLVAVEAPVKAKKPKLVRDSFTIPKNEYEAIASLKERALKQGVSIKKSELLRAGLMTLAFMPDAAFAKALADVPTLKTGRPAAKKGK